MNPESEVSPCQCISTSGVVISTCVLLLGYFFLRKNPRIAYHLKRLGGPSGVPVFGNVLSFQRPHDEYLPVWDKWVKKHGAVFSIWLTNLIPYVGITDANIAEKVLNTNAHIEKGKFEYSLLHSWLGTGLLTAPPNKWATRRKLLTPSFHFKILEDFIPIFNEQAGIFVDCLDKEAGTGKKFDISKYISKCTLDIICETAMGKKMNIQTSSSNRKYFDAVNSTCELLMEKLFRPWYRIPFVYNFTSMSKTENENLTILKGFTEQVIQARKRERLEKSQVNEVISEEYTGKKRKAFLDLLLEVSESGGSFTDEDIREEVDTFMFEGHDTTALSLSWTMLLLSCHPECQKLVHAELDEIFGDNPERDVTTGDLPKMKYLEYCIKESLRLFPSVPFFMRQINSDIPLDDGKVIPKGCTVSIAVYYIHRNLKHYENPLEFKPERFSLENSAGRHPYAYIPFSAGSRNCIGQKFALMEEKVILAKFFQNYKLLAGDKVENVRAVPDIVLRPKDGINVVLRKRQ